MRENQFELVGDRGEIGRRGCLSGVVWRLKREFGVLGVEVVEARLEPREALVAAFG